LAALSSGADRTEDLPGARVDQIDAAEVPAGIAQMDVLETAIPGRDLEALAIETHRAVGTALLALDLDAERIAQLIAARALAGDVGAGEEALHRRLPSSLCTVR
jgi:hypothetical protein